MEAERTTIEDVIILTPKVFADSRGFFMETFREDTFEKLGITTKFVQENHSKSIGKVTRGLHYQIAPFAQAKLVRCTQGRIFDVAVDIRPGSKTFGEWVGVELSEENKKQVYIPEGFAHGFCTLTEEAEVMYKCNRYYSKEHERGVRWNDPELKIDWPLNKSILSEKDNKLPLFKEINLKELKN